jgi:hypothetical protein
MADALTLRPQFNYRRINGVTELRLKDDALTRSSLAKEFLGFGRLIEGCTGGQASFEEIKSHPEFAAFIEGVGKGMSTELYIRAEHSVVTRRSVLAVCDSGKVRATCSWDVAGGISFETFAV